MYVVVRSRRTRARKARGTTTNENRARASRSVFRFLISHRSLSRFHARSRLLVRSSAGCCCGGLAASSPPPVQRTFVLPLPFAVSKVMDARTASIIPLLGGIFVPYDRTKRLQTRSSGFTDGRYRRRSFSTASVWRIHLVTHDPAPQLHSLFSCTGDCPRCDGQRGAASRRFNNNEEERTA